MSQKRARSGDDEEEEEEPAAATTCDQCPPLATPLGAPLCSMCDLCVKHCLFGLEVCTCCRGHKEGLEVPGGLYCEECACTVCSARYTDDNEMVGDLGCTACYVATDAALVY